jgi:NitT/TauT family transport system substrate-binding protein
MFKNWLCFSGAQTTSEQVDFACMPLTMAFMLYNKGVDLKLINVSTWGIFYIVGQDIEITSIEDLKGKEIAVSDVNSGGLHSSTLRHILIQNNIDPESDVKLVQMDMTEMSTKLAMGEIELAFLNEPKSSATIAAAKANNIELKRLLDLEEEWRKITPNKDGKIPQAGIVVVGQHAENKAMVDGFSARYIESANWINNNREEAGKIVEKYFEQMKAGGVSASLPYAKLNPVPAKECRKNIEAFFNEYLKTASPKIIGGQMPDEDIYYVSE